MLQRRTTVICDGPSTDDCHREAPVVIVTGIKDAVGSNEAGIDARKAARKFGWVRWRFGVMHMEDDGATVRRYEWRDYCPACAPYWKDARA